MAAPSAKPARAAALPAFERRPWGGFSTIEEGPGYKVKRLVVDPGHRFSYQTHRRRAQSRATRRI